jgi:hypothetical protein
MSSSKKGVLMEYEKYMQAIRTKVCAKCIDGDGFGNCRVDPAIDCAIQKYLPLIVQAVGRVTSVDMDDYVRELRAITCAQCSHESVNGYCMLRKDVDCALDRYFPLVVEAIEEVNAGRHVT